MHFHKLFSLFGAPSYRNKLFIKLVSNQLQHPRLVHNLSLNDKVVQNYLKEYNKQQDDSPHLSFIVQEILKNQSELNELMELAKENAELKDIAKTDSESILQKLKDLESQFFESVIEPEPSDQSDVVLEVSAGVGGQEAMLFAQEVFNMYKSYAEYKGWEFMELDRSVTELGGLRHSSSSITGHNIYKTLKFEGGVHRVQRVPKTEKSGRIHTSTCTVAILPSPSEIEVQLNPNDLKIETKRATGAGGQHVNTTESAVRITHIPTGLSVDSQTARSQIQNRSIGLTLLRAKLYEKKFEEQLKSIRNTRKLQVGLATRNEKIRTYNYPQDRVTDHRIGLTLYNLNGVLQGGKDFDELVNSLLEYDQRERLIGLFDNKS